MPQQSRTQTFVEFALCLVAFSIPFPFIYASVAIGILALAWLVRGHFRYTFSNLADRKVLWLWMIYFLLHAASYYYSDNKEQSAFDTQQKLSFLILPILIGAGVSVNKRTLERVFASFVTGTTLIALFCLAKAASTWQTTHNNDGFFYHELVKGLEANAVYMAWYYIFSISLLLFMPWEHFFKRKFFKIALIILQTAFFILLSSRTLIALFFVFIVPFYFIRLSGGLSKARIAIGITALALLGLAIVLTDNPIRNRYKDIYNTKIELAFKNDYHDVAEGDFNNLTLRVFLWRLGIMNVSEHNLWLTGAGNGDAQALQNQKMEQIGIRNINEPIYRSPFYNANLHNMFMQSLVMLGLPGALTLLLIALLPLLHLRNILYPQVFLIFHVIALFFLMQEAALQTQAGVIYYSFFSLIFWNIRFYDPIINEK